VGRVPRKPDRPVAAQYDEAVSLLAELLLDVAASEKMRRRVQHWQDPRRRPHQPGTCDPHATAGAEATLVDTTARGLIDGVALGAGPFHGPRTT
jgi:hypothetical protein